MGDSVPALKCQPEDGSDCNERETKYIAKTKTWDAAKQTSELARVQGLLGNPMSDDLRDWARRRVHILEALTAPSGDETIAEL